jgi:hypothetical protein
VAYSPAVLFFLALAFVAVMLFHYSLEISRLSDQNKMLAQELASCGPGWRWPPGLQRPRGRRRHQKLICRCLTTMLSNMPRATKSVRSELPP